jgi:chemotaxis protein MotA
VTEIGHKVAAAGGHLPGHSAAYGFIGPMANAIEKKVAEEGSFFTVIKTRIIAMVQAYAPQVATEFGRKVTPRNSVPASRNWKIT